ncbi:MAG: BCCT family transporter, partial [Desulfonatronovibrio sp.]
MSSQNENNSSPSWYKINPPVFFGSAGIIIIFIIFTLIDPGRASDVFGSIQNWIVQTAGWFYILAVATFLLFVVFLGLSRYGDIKLGPDHSSPDYTYISWFAMLFSAGMGIGLMFFGVAEPVMHYLNPPVGDAGTIEAAREAMKITFFHWGVHAWAIYAVVAISLAYFSYRHGLPLTIRSAFYPLIGERIYGPVGHTVDILAVFGTMFGVATSLGLGVMQINSGLEYLFGVPNSIMIQIILIIIITAIATVSVVLGLDGGIRRLSELNMVLAITIVAFVLIAGPTIFLLQAFTQNVGTYVADLISMTFNLYAYEPTGWLGGWTLFYWGWWISWSPFVGMFIARVSKGRTIREFVMGVLMVPVGFTFMWMTFFGNTALHMILVDGITQLGDAVAADTTVALFQFFEHLPFSTIASLLATTLVVTFFVTSSDSGSLVVDMLTSGGEEDAPVWQRIFWASAKGVVAAVLLLAGGLGALQTATIASALPFTVIMVFMCWGLFRALRIDAVKKNALQTATIMPAAMTAGSWKKHLRTLVYQPGKNEVEQFIQNTVKPALTEFKDELRKRNLEARIQEGDDGRVWLEVLHQEEIDFFYSVRPRPYIPPAFALSDTRKKQTEKSRFYRAEVHLKEGGQDYDIMNWNKEQIINDVLNQYNRHLQFLDEVR